MKERHHIYNFHIGFWGAFLISLSILIQSAVFLLADSVITHAAQGIVITVPVAGAHFAQGASVNLVANDPGLLSQPFNFLITEKNNPTNAQLVPGTSQDFINWFGTWDSGQSNGEFLITASANNFAGNPQTSNTVSIFLDAPQTPVVIVDVSSPSPGEVVTAPKQFILTTDSDVQRVDIILTNSAGQDLPTLLTQGGPTAWNSSFDPTSVPTGSYTFVAKAFVGGQMVGASSPILFSTSPATQDSTSVTKPLPGATISGIVQLEASTTTLATSVKFSLVNPQASETGIVATEKPGNIWVFDTYDTTNLPNGTYTLTSTAVIAGATKTNSISVTINNATQADPITITTNTIPGGTVGTAYNATLVATGGTPPYSWSISAGALPSGMTLTNAGKIQGVPTAGGAFNITIKATGSAGQSTTRQYGLNIATLGPVCGDGIKAGTEACDDGNLLNGDGCSALCTIEQAPAVCGNNLVEGAEQCDDGNTTSGDGCTSTCTVEANAPTPAKCGDGTVDTGEQCDDGNKNSGDGCSRLCLNEPAPVLPPQDNTVPPPVQQVTPTLSLLLPGGSVMKGNNVLMELKSDIGINEPKILLVNEEGKNVLPSTAKPFLPPNNDNFSRWQLRIDSTKFLNGKYKIQATATARDGGALGTLVPQSATIVNQEATVPGFTGGSIKRPLEGANVNGIVLIEAQISGEIKAVKYILTDSTGKNFEEVAQLDPARGLYRATWDSTRSTPGPVSLRAEVTLVDSTTTKLPQRNFILKSITQQGTQPLTEPRPEEIIPPQILNNVNDDGTMVTTPVECQIVGIKDEKKCDEYLKARAIRILNPTEQKKVAEDLNLVVSRHIEVGEGLVTNKDFKAGSTQKSQKQIEDPLSGITPINKTREKNASFLVIPSTSPPDHISRFVEQTVPAILIADQDGDGLPDDAEIRYGTNPSNPDSDGDGFMDGEEVKNGFNPLGGGLLTTVLAPTDVAILNGRPLDQPRFAGVTDNASIRVEGVDNADQQNVEDDSLRLQGKADPNSFITLYIYSSLPMVVTVQADASGNWEYDLTHPLVDGKHDVYATVTNETGKIVKKSDPFSFFVNSANAMSEEEFLQSSVSVQDSSSTFFIWYMVAGALIVMLAGVMFFYYVKQQKAYN